MKYLSSLLLVCFLWGFSTSVKAAEVYIISPKDGDVVEASFVVKFGLRGMGVAPAGMEKAGTGHHHLLIDTILPDLNFAVPKDQHHVHFGGGQTETTITLEGGEHTLQLLMGDHNHLPHVPPIVSEKITITVVSKPSPEILGE